MQVGNLSAWRKVGNHEIEPTMTVLIDLELSEPYGRGVLGTIYLGLVSTEVENNHIVGTQIR